MKALAEARAHVAEWNAIGYTVQKGHAVELLAALVEAIDAAPYCVLIPTYDPATYEARTQNANAIHGCYLLKGNRVAILPLDPGNG